MHSSSEDAGPPKICERESKDKEESQLEHCEAYERRQWREGTSAAEYRWGSAWQETVTLCEQAAMDSQSKFRFQCLSCGKGLKWNLKLQMTLKSESNLHINGFHIKTEPKIEIEFVYRDAMRC